MSRKNIPLTPAQMAHDSSVRNMRSAIYAQKGADTLTALLDIMLDTAKVVAQESPEYFSMYDLQQRYGISRKTLETYDIPIHKFGGSIRFSRENVMIWEEAHLQELDK